MSHPTTGTLLLIMKRQTMKCPSQPWPPSPGSLLFPIIRNHKKADFSLLAGCCCCLFFWDTVPSPRNGRLIRKRLNRSVLGSEPMEGNKAERKRLKGKVLNQVIRLGDRYPNLLSHLPEFYLPGTHILGDEVWLSQPMAVSMPTTIINK